MGVSPVLGLAHRTERRCLESGSNPDSIGTDVSGGGNRTSLAHLIQFGGAHSSGVRLGLKISFVVPTGRGMDMKETKITEDQQNSGESENRRAEILGDIALAVAGLVTVVHLLAG